MKISILKERRNNEPRVATTPEVVKKLVEMGFDVFVEKGAGELSSFSDAAYKAAGAKISANAKDALSKAEIILKVCPPLAKGEGAVDEVSHLAKDSVLISMLQPYTNEDGIKKYAASGITAISLEMIPRISRAQSMDVLSSQANLGGYRAVIDAASEYGRAFPMMMTAAGTVPPAKVLVVGAGVAGLQAIATAKRLGAVVYAFDVRPEVKEQVESLGGKFVEVADESVTDSKKTGGYAKEMSKDYKKRQAEKMASVVAESDIVITTALIPGKPAPRLIDSAMIKKMKQGSVLLDMAVETGGNIEGSKLEKVVENNGVKIIGYSNLPGRLAAEASTLYARNILNLLKLIWDPENKKLNIDFNDEIISSSVLTSGGKIVHPQFKGVKAPVKKAMDKTPAPKKKVAPKKTVAKAKQANK